MNPEIIQGLTQVGYLATQGHCRPEFPVTAKAHVFVCSANLFINTLSKNDGAGIGDGIVWQKKAATCLGSIAAEVRSPTTRGARIDVNKEAQYVVLTDATRAAEGKGNFRFAVEHSYQPFEKTHVGIVV